MIASLATGKALDGTVPEGKIKEVTMLGHAGKLKFVQDTDGLKVTLPADRPCDYAYTLKITGLKMNAAGAGRSRSDGRSAVGGELKSARVARIGVKLFSFRGSDAMAQVRLLVGTRKGAFVMTSDGARKNWKISGPHFAGWEVYHMKGSPVDPNRIYASQSSSWSGQVMQRSDDGGETWTVVGNKFAYDGVPGTHSGTTARRIRGSSSGCGTWSRR